MLATTNSLYQKADAEWMAANLRDDLALQLFARKQGYIRELDRNQVDRLANRLGYAMEMCVRPGFSCIAKRSRLCFTGGVMTSD